MVQSPHAGGVESWRSASWTWAARWWRKYMSGSAGPIPAKPIHSLAGGVRSSDITSGSVSGGSGCTAGDWEVVVRARPHGITRLVRRNGRAWVPESQTAPGDGQHPADGQVPAEVIWPAWPATLAEEIAAADSPLGDLEQNWSASISWLRDSAEWTATVLGAALACIHIPS